MIWQKQRAGLTRCFLYSPVVPDNGAQKRDVGVSSCANGVVRHYVRGVVTAHITRGKDRGNFF